MGGAQNAVSSATNTVGQATGMPSTANKLGGSIFSAGGPMGTAIENKIANDNAMMQMKQNLMKDLQQSQRPDDVKWNSLINSSTGRLQDQLQLQNDPRALQALQSRALGSGDSPYAAAQRAQLGQQYAGAKDEQALSQAKELAGARGQLAQRGGLTKGAGERLARQNMVGGMMSRQDLSKQNLEKGLGITTQDEAARMGLLEKLPGLQNMSQEADKFNIGGTMNEQNAARARQMQVYDSQMKQWAAAQAAKGQLVGAAPSGVSGKLSGIL